MEDDMVHDAEDELFKNVCSFCDDGGDVLSCEGRCMRSFHATVDAGAESRCVSLGLTKDEVEAMQNVLCKNCKYKMHQCFACGKLGSSDKKAGAEVFSCVSATCGHFYHPHCVSKLLFRDDEVAADQFQKSIIAGESFTCPLHKCYICKQGENKADLNLQFAVCRRCPKAYHRKCLPRKIAFEDKLEEGTITRAWEGLLPNKRILIYCLRHEIDDELATPIRDHIIYPGVEEKKSIIEGPRKKMASAIPAGKLKAASIKSSLTSEVYSQGKFAVKALKCLASTAGQGETTKKCERLLVGSDSSRKVKATGVSRKSLKGIVKSVSVELGTSSSADKKKTSLGDRLYILAPRGTGQTKLGKQDNLDSENNKTVTVKPPRKKSDNELPSLDADSERRLLSLMKDAASLVSVEEILKKHKIPSTHVYSSKSVVDKAITLGKVEGSVEAIRTALKKLEVDGSIIEDAKAVCEPEVLNQIFKWKFKLGVYLAPFLHGMRYTSFGRHFTKVDKLQEIVDKFHWYVKDGDMIVDFCCGANDFSCLMKKKLDETGKKCLYKNYDILQAKNDFNFEKRDWMTVEPKELAPGSQLIMGLNPPFGVKAALANKFINKALEFNPKLLILIVPPDTERLDRKKTPYELVWEDDHFLSGRSFYLPGSVDENDKQMDQWNLTALPLYLWSCRELAAEHKAVAEKHGHIHISRQQKHIQLESNCYKADTVDHSKEEDRGDTSMLIDLPLQSNEARELIQEARGDEGGSLANATERWDESSHGHGNNQSYKNSRKRKRGKNNSGSGISEKSPLDGQNGRRHLASGIYDGMSQHSPANIIDVSSSMEVHSSKLIDMPSHVGFGDDDRQHFGNKGMPYSCPANVIDCKSSLEGRSSKSVVMPSHDEGYQCNEKPHSCTENKISGISSLEGPFSKPIDMPSNVRNTDSLGYRQQARTYEQGFAAPAPGYGQMGSLSSNVYGNLGSSAEASYRMSTSAMDRYAPRLGEFSNTRMSSFRSEPLMQTRSGFSDPRAPQPGFLADTDLAPGFHPSIPHQGSGGWLDD